MASMRTCGLLASTALAAVMGLGTMGAASAQPAGSGIPPGSTSIQEYRWQWSDTSQFVSRTFVHAVYATPESMPTLIVTVTPALPARMVYLEFFQDGEWVPENMMRTDGTGIAELAVDPYCHNGTWCNGTYKYRLKIGGLRAPLSITYYER